MPDTHPMEALQTCIQTHELAQNATSKNIVEEW